MLKEDHSLPTVSRAFVIANIADEFDSFYQSSDRYHQYIFEENLLSERGLFWSDASDILLASPVAIPKDYIRWITTKLQKKKIKVIYPQDSDQPIFSFLSENKQIEEIRSWMNTDINTTVSLIAYAATENLDKFVKLLISKKIHFNQETLPTSSFWAKRRGYSSKIGFKRILENLSKRGTHIESIQYIPCDDLDSIYSAVVNFLSLGKAVIVKPNEGNSGIGTLRFYTDDLVTNRTKIKRDLEQNAFLKDNLAIVEELLIASSGLVESPSLEIFVPQPPRLPLILYWSRQIISRTGGFLGLIINNLAPQMPSQVIAEGHALQIAAFLQTEGYRGFFDIDFVVRNDGQYIPVEINLRRTGGTHAYNAMVSLLGKDIDNYVIISREEFDIGIPRKWGTVCIKIQDLFISTEKKVGLIPVNVNMTRNGRLGFIIIGNTLENALNTQDELRLRLLT
jgi:hypothetical protein